MISLSIKIWWKGVIVFSILCALLALPTMCISLLALALGLVISLPSILVYNAAIYILNKSEASSGNALFFLFITSVPAVLLAFFFINLLVGGGWPGLNFNRFYVNPIFYGPWLCSIIGIYFSKKEIHEFFAEEKYLLKAIN